jgi:hypothetical protein
LVGNRDHLIWKNSTSNILGIWFNTVRWLCMWASNVVIGELPIRRTDDAVIDALVLRAESMAIDALTLQSDGMAATGLAQWADGMTVDGTSS